MPNSTNVRFPYDPTGINPDNSIQGEIHSLTSHAVRAVAPVYGPFFTTSLQVFDNTSDTLLVKGTDYEVVEMLEDITLRLGKEVCNLILILNQTVSASVRLNYQVVGGLYQNSAAALINMYETVLQDARPVAWENVLGKPLLFPPTTHLHNLEDVYGFEPIVGALERVRNAIVLSDVPAFEALVDWVNGQISVLSGSVSSSTTMINNLTTVVNTEITNRTNADNGLSAALQTEINNRVTGDNGLSAALQTEINNRVTGDNSLASALQAEITNRINAVATKQDLLGFTPVQQGGGVGQLANKVYLGWGNNSRVKMTVDSTDMGNVVFDGQLNGALGNYLPLSGGYLSGKLWSSALNSSATYNDGSSSLEVRNNGGTGDWGVAAIGFHCLNNYAIKMHLRADGYFGIGGWSRSAWSWYSAPDGSMYAAGTINTGGSVIAAGDVYAYSDPRLKDDVVPITNALAICEQLNGVMFTWNDKSKLVACKVGKRDYGLLADQVKAVMPEIVAPSPKLMDCDDVYDTVAYEKTVPVLLEAIKELHAKIKVLEERTSIIQKVIDSSNSLFAKAKALFEKV